MAKVHNKSSNKIKLTKQSNPRGKILSRFRDECALAGTLLGCFFLFCNTAHAEEITYDQFCDAVYIAEGGQKAKKPYGILSVPCNTESECRKICINSVRNNLKRFNNQSKYDDYIDFFGSRWCPVGAENDPTGLNKYWINNVRLILKGE